MIGQLIRLREALRSHALSSNGNFFDSAADMQQDDDVIRRYGTEAFRSDSVIRISIQALSKYDAFFNRHDNNWKYDNNH